MTFVPHPRNRAGVPIAFDTGPGNVWIDMAAGAVLASSSAVSDGAHVFDDGGRLAATGCVNRSLLEDMLAMPYFAVPPPKTTGREVCYGTQLMC